MASFCSVSVNQNFNVKSSEYLRSRYKSIPQEASLDIYEDASTSEVESYIKSTLMDKYGYSEEDIDYLLFFNQKIVLPSNYSEGGAVDSATEYFVQKFKMTQKEVRELLLHYPIYLRYNKEKLDERIKYSIDLGL